jgi:phage regulator Rha-like protein
MKNKLVIIRRENEGRAGTFLIAKGFGRRHEQVVRLVKKHKARFENFSTLRVSKIRTKGRSATEYLLTQDQFFFLGTLFKNSELALDFKEKLIKEFSRVRKQLLAAKSQHSDQKWIMSRDFGKEQRLEMTDTVKKFVAYARSQGSGNADRYYTIITRMMNGLLFICGDKFKNLREVLTAKQLMIVANAESIISKGLEDGMKAKTFYKDIYKDVKQRVFDFAGLTGQTHVIEEQLKLAEEK